MAYTLSVNTFNADELHNFTPLPHPQGQILEPPLVAILLIDFKSNL